MMTFLLFIQGILFFTGFLKEANDYPPIRLNVTHISARKGDVLVALFNSDKGFPGDKAGAIRFARGRVLNGKSLIVFDDVPSGTYAIALFHDTNGDGKLTFNFLGIPKEGYGFSNNARKMFNAPSFRQASFFHVKETDLEIKMQY